MQDIHTAFWNVKKQTVSGDVTGLTVQGATNCRIERAQECVYIDPREPVGLTLRKQNRQHSSNQNGSQTLGGLVQD